ncbi:MAG: hypothetical protein LBQ58_04445 [Synergistaceae bacterium]|nr:hypothetical protein [Synergistaceae bacterium]
MRRIKESHEAIVLGYIPTRLYVGMSLVTFGLYPYSWMWDNARAFVKIGGDRIRVASIRHLALVGFCVQLLLPVIAVFCCVGWFTGSAQVYLANLFGALMFGVLQIFIILPLKCSLYFRLRWMLRNAVISWDRDGLMIERTVTSWLKLFFLGSIYIQYHINRLIGLGMPGFADADEIEMDRTLGELIDDYIIIGKTDYNPESWTKDDWESDDDDG